MDNLIDVKMETPENGKVNQSYDYKILKFDRLGKEIKISPKSCVTVNKEGFKSEYFVESVCITIGIGNNHCADLIMSVEAWQALNKGEKVSIYTTQDFKKKYVHNYKGKK